MSVVDFPLAPAAPPALSSQYHALARRQAATLLELADLRRQLTALRVRYDLALATELRLSMQLDHLRARFPVSTEARL